MEKAPQGIADLIMDQPGGVSHVPELPSDALELFMHHHVVTRMGICAPNEPYKSASFPISRAKIVPRHNNF